MTYRTRATKPLTLLALAISALPACAIDVYLDFTGGAETLLAGSWVDGGYPAMGSSLAFGPSDFLIIQHSVKAKMESIFSGYTITFSNFAAVPSGPHTKLDFNKSGGDPGLLGESPTLDWRNTTKTEIVDVYSGKFGGTFVAGTTAAEKERDLDRLSTALTNIAAHELGHSLGLQHYDAYGMPDLRAPGYSPVTGAQNSKLMSSGPSGATLMGLGDGLKVLSDLSKVKLEFADGVVAAPGTTVDETADPNDSIATAQVVATSLLALSGIPAVNINATLTGETDDDYYAFDAVMGSLLTFNTFSETIYGDSSDTTIRLYDATGTLLFGNNNISYTPTSFMSGAGLYGTDSLIMNYEAGYTGRYYLRVSGTEAGRYNLLAIGAVPEPGTLVLLGMGLAGIATRRKRKTA